MTRQERYEIKQMFGAKLWRRYKDRVELVRNERRAQMMSEGQAAKAWEIVLKEQPFADAYKFQTGESPEPEASSDAPASPEIDDFSGCEAFDEDEGAEDPESQKVKQSAQADTAWVASVLHKKGIKRKDAPSDAAYNMYVWVRAEPAHMSKFMESRIKLGSTKEGANAAKMGDDGREALEHVERVLDREFGESK